MTERIQSANSQLNGDCDDSGQRFRRVAVAPRISGEHISSGGDRRRSETEASAAEQVPTASRLDQVGTCRPPIPFRIAESKKPLGVFEGLVPRPAEIPGNVWIARVPGVGC